MGRHRIRIRFSKTGSLCFIGHKDLLRTMERLFRRAQLPLSMSEGFHPKIRMSFPSALALGFAALNEVLELELTEPMQAHKLLERLNSVSVSGLCFQTAEPVAVNDKKAAIFSSVFEWTVNQSAAKQIAEKLAEFKSADSVDILKPNGKTVDVRKSVRSFELDAETGNMKVELLSTDGADATIREFLKAIELEKNLFDTIFPVRTRVLLK